MAYAHIVAPFTGRVGLRLVDPGNLVQSSGSTPLAVVTQIEPITVIFTLSQDNLEQVLAQTRHGNTLRWRRGTARRRARLAQGN